MSRQSSLNIRQCKILSPKWSVNEIYSWKFIYFGMLICRLPVQLWFRIWWQCWSSREGWPCARRWSWSFPLVLSKHPRFHCTINNTEAWCGTVHKWRHTNSTKNWSPSVTLKWLLLTPLFLASWKWVAPSLLVAWRESCFLLSA